MADNQERLRHGRVFQHASIHREITRPSQSPDGGSSFDAEAPTSGVQVSSVLSSRKQVSHIAAPEAPLFQVDALATDIGIS